MWLVSNALNLKSKSHFVEVGVLFQALPGVNLPFTLVRCSVGLCKQQHIFCELTFLVQDWQIMADPRFFARMAHIQQNNIFICSLLKPPFFVSIFANIASSVGTVGLRLSNSQRDDRDDQRLPGCSGRHPKLSNQRTTPIGAMPSAIGGFFSVGKKFTLPEKRTRFGGKTGAFEMLHWKKVLVVSSKVELVLVSRMYWESGIHEHRSLIIML